MAAAVSGLSPVIMTVRMPMRRSSANRSRTPALITSFSAITPSNAPSAATASGVCPCRAMSSDTRRRSAAAAVSALAGLARKIASTAPFCTSLCPTRMPDIRVCAVKGITSAPVGIAFTTRPWPSYARRTIERPSGVSSARLASNAASASAAAETPGNEANVLACRSPMVIVPVLSSSNTSTSPAASTARPDLARTLNRTRRSIPAMPMADSSAAIVVGISVISKAASTATGMRPPA